MSAIKVTATIGHFTLTDHKRESVSIYATVPALGEKPIWFTVDTDNGGRPMYSNETWSEFVTGMCGLYIENTWVSTAKKDVERLLAWVSEEANAAAMDAAWAEREAAECDKQQAALDKRRTNAAEAAAACAAKLNAAKANPGIQAPDSDSWSQADAAPPSISAAMTAIAEDEPGGTVWDAAVSGDKTFSRDREA